MYSSRSHCLPTMYSSHSPPAVVVVVVEVEVVVGRGGQGQEEKGGLVGPLIQSGQSSVMRQDWRRKHWSWYWVKFPHPAVTTHLNISLVVKNHLAIVQ